MEEVNSKYIEQIMEKARSQMRAAKLNYDNNFFEDAISRAYYAMFNAARAVLCTYNKYPKTHRGVRIELSRILVKQGHLDPKYAKMLKNAKDYREIGDYEASFRASGEQAQEIIEEAEEFLKQMKNLLKKRLEGK